jgi:hypothetical protein
MCIEAFKMKNILTLFFLLFSIPVSYAIDTSKEEATCIDIGFKKRTEGYANCVLELVERNSKSVSQNITGDPDDATCKRYGFKAGTPDYGRCRQQIDIAKADAAQKQREYEARQREYQAQQRAYAAQAAQDEKDRKLAAGLALMGMGSRMMQGQSPYFSENVGAAARGQIAPSPPQPQIYTLPGGRSMTCTTTGNVTNCM